MLLRARGGKGQTESPCNNIEQRERHGERKNESDTKRRLFNSLVGLRGREKRGGSTRLKQVSVKWRKNQSESSKGIPLKLEPARKEAG